MQTHKLGLPVRRVGSSARHGQHKLAATLHRADNDPYEIDQDQAPDAGDGYLEDSPGDPLLTFLGIIYLFVVLGKGYPA